MKEKDIERFIKTLLSKSLVVSYKDKPVTKDYGTSTKTHYLIVKSAKYMRVWDDINGGLTETNSLRLLCPLDITITKSSYGHTGRKSSFSRLVIFDTFRTLTSEELASLNVPRDNRLPKDVERQVEKYLNKHVDEARKQVERFNGVLQEHNMTEATEGLE